MKKEIEDAAIKSLIEAGKKTGFPITEEMARNILAETIRLYNSPEEINPELRKQLNGIIQSASKKGTDK